jgi:uncharacterized damage-inducible protein DinB
VRKVEKPKDGEFSQYAKMYMDLLPDDGLLLKHLKENFDKTREFILSIPEEKLTYRYAKNKWTIKEILVHIIDDERIYAYRALCFARNDKTELPGFEQDDYSLFSNANERSIENILNEYEAVRNATITLFEGFDETALLRKGIANKNKATVRALGYHLAGHELHHINIIKEKYLTDECFTHLSQSIFPHHKLHNLKKNIKKNLRK